MKIKDITDISVHGISEYKPEHYAIGWNANGARYHIWNGERLNILYKNPPLGTPRYVTVGGYERKNPANYDTRKLDPNAKAHADVIAHVLKFVADNDLVAKARKAEQDERDAKQAAARAAELAGYRKAFADHGPYVLDILSDDELIALGRAIKNS